MCASVPDEQQFTPGQLLTLLKEDDLKLGIIIDLTNTARYYDPNVSKKSPGHPINAVKQALPKMLKCP